MEIGVLADILGKSASELQDALNLDAETKEVSVDVFKKEITNHITNVEKSALSKGKEQGKGWGERESKKEVEKLLAESFGLSGQLPDMVNSLKTKFESSQSANPDTALQKKYETTVEKLNMISKQFDDYKADISKKEEKSFLMQKLNPVLSKFEASDKLKDLVTKDYLSSIKYQKDGNEIDLLDNNDKLLKKDGNYISFEEHAEQYFSNVLPVGKVEKKKPNLPGGGAAGYSPKANDIEGLMKELRGAKTADERAAIQERIKELDN